MKMAFQETKRFIETVLHLDFSNLEEIRAFVQRDLSNAGYTEGQLYAGIADHGPGMRLTSEQWLKILQTYRNKVFWSQLDLSSLLSENHLRKLFSL
jgi:hypothetical protein